MWPFNLSVRLLIVDLVGRHHVAEGTERVLDRVDRIKHGFLVFLKVALLAAPIMICGTLGLRYGPDSYGRQQWGILHNGGNPDAATPREG